MELKSQQKKKIVLNHLELSQVLKIVLPFGR